MVRFLRSDTARHSRLGKNRRKLQKWRRPRGMHSKIRRKRFGYPTFPTVGHKSPRATSGLIDGKKPMVVESIAGLSNVGKNNLVVISRRIGAKKRIELLKKIEEMKLDLMKTNRRSK